MLDKDRIRLMARMTAYENATAEEDIKISSYYKKDYVSLNILITIIWITLGYTLAAGLFVLCGLDFLLKNLTMAKMITLIAIAVGAYLTLVIVYGVFAAGYYRSKHNKSKQRVKRYYRDLSHLEKIMMKEKR